MRKLLTIVLVAIMAMCLIGTLSSCNKDNGNSLDIQLVDNLPTITPYQDFDVRTAYKVEKGVAYLYEGIYVTNRGAEKELTFDGSVINIPQDDVVAEINITAIKGTEQTSKVVKLNVKGTPDLMDDGYAALWHEDSISKTINYDPQYVVDGNTSVKVQFGGYYNEYGTQAFNLNGHLSTETEGIIDKEYLSIYKETDVDKAWEDAIYTFWVYYATTPNGYANTTLEFGYRYASHHKSGDPNKIDVEFKQTPIISCPLGQWKLVAFRLKDIGLTTDMYLDVDNYYTIHGFDGSCDMMALKCRAVNPAFTSGEIKYNYSFYFDKVDIMSYAQFTETYPSYDFGVDYGDTIGKKFSVNNWYTSNNGIAINFKLADLGNTASNRFSIVADTGSSWDRLTNYIELNFANNTATVGNLISLGNGKYRYELMFADCPLNDSPGEIPSGTEKANLLYFNEYQNAMLISDIEVIDNYSN